MHKYPSLTPKLFVCCCPGMTGTFFGVASLYHCSLASYNHPVPQEVSTGYEIQTFWPTFQISTVLFFSDVKYVTVMLTAHGIFQSDEMKVFFPLTLLTLS